MNNVVYLVDGSQVLGRSQTVAQLLYQEISAREDRGDTSEFIWCRWCNGSLAYIEQAKLAPASSLPWGAGLRYGDNLL